MNRQILLVPTLTLVVLATGLTMVAPAEAATTGQLTGFVVDEEGNPLPGVTVSASSPTQIGGVLTTETDIQGWFQYPRLNPGYFPVRLEFEGDRIYHPEKYPNYNASNYRGEYSWPRWQDCNARPEGDSGH